ncbi:MAG TPA: LysM domain-containing protein [Jiangellaceae bacterium]
MITRLCGSAAVGVVLLATARFLAGSVGVGWISAGSGFAGIDDVVGLLAGLVACGLLGWMGLLSVMAAAVQVPGLAGRIAAHTARGLVPSTATGLLRIGLCMAAVSTPVTATLPATAADVSVGSHDPEDGGGPATIVLPGVGRPAITPTRADAARPTSAGQSQAQAHGRSNGAGGSTPDAVVVVSGDCLWTIAARAIGPDATDAEIAVAWPRWYARNRVNIGTDPDLLIPGMVLRPPA